MGKWDKVKVLKQKGILNHDEAWYFAYTDVLKEELFNIAGEQFFDK